MQGHLVWHGLNESLDQIQVTLCNRFLYPGGDVWHALKSTEESFQGFGEAYFSWVETEIDQGLEAASANDNESCRTNRNGALVFCDLLNHSFREEEIGASNYARITVPPKSGLDSRECQTKPSLVLNLANLPHDPAEVERKMKEEIHFNWRKDS